jgi:hypothetical protein
MEFTCGTAISITSASGSESQNIPNVVSGGLNLKSTTAGTGFEQADNITTKLGVTDPLVIP